jgi:hypothetical protein
MILKKTNKDIIIDALLKTKCNSKAAANLLGYSYQWFNTVKRSKGIDSRKLKEMSHYKQIRDLKSGNIAYSNAEIADIVGVSKTTVGNVLNEGK